MGCQICMYGKNELAGLLGISVGGIPGAENKWAFQA